MIGRLLDVPVVSKYPEEAANHFGVFAGFVGMGGPSSNKAHSGTSRPWLRRRFRGKDAVEVCTILEEDQHPKDTGQQSRSDTRT